jgi:hypothetical protein
VIRPAFTGRSVHVERIDVALATDEPRGFRIAVSGHASGALVRGRAMGRPRKRAAGAGGSAACVGTQRSKRLQTPGAHLIDLSAVAPQRDLVSRLPGDGAPWVCEAADSRRRRT